MAVDILSLGFKVDTAPVKNASKDLDKLGESAKGTGKSLAGMGTDADKASKLTNTLATSIKSLGAIAGAGYIIKMADEYTKLTAQLKIATNSTQEYNAALKEVSRIASVAQADIGSIAVLYARLSNTLKDVGVNQLQVSKVSETVALALKVSGASATESASTMLQLSQAFASGVLRGEEFNAVSEASFPLMKALADSMGVPIGALRELASNGQITRTELLKAFGDDKLLSMFREQAKQVNTIGGAFTDLKNTFVQMVGVFSEKTGIVDLFTTAIKDLNTTLLVLAGISDFNFNLEKFLPDYKNYLASQKKEGAPSPAASFGGKQILASGSRMDSPVPRIDIGNLKDANVEYDKLKATFLEWQKNNPLKDAVAAQREYASNLELINKLQAQGIISIQEGDRYRAQFNKELHKGDKKDAEEKAKAYLQMKKEFAAMDEKYNDIATAAENKVLEQRKKNEKEEYDNKIKYLDLAYARSQKENEEAQRDFIKAEEDKLRQFEKTVDGINQVFREGFANLINGGMSSWKAFTKQLYTTFKTAVADKIYKLFAEPFIFNVIVSIAGVSVAGSANASSITGSSGGSIFSTITDSIKSLNNNIVGSLESFGSFLTDGFGQLGSDIGGYIGANSAAIADGFSYAGALFQAAQGNFTGAIGTAIGTWFGGPVGGAIGSMVGSLVGGMFGGGHVSRPKYYANTKVSNSGTSLINAYGNSDASGTGGDVAINSGKGLGEAILAYTKAFGGTSKDFTIGTNYQSKYNTYLATIGGATAKNGVGSDFQFKPEQAMNATALAFVTAVKKGLVTIPDYLTNVIKRSDVNIGNALDSMNALGSVMQMKKALADLPPVFSAIANVIDNTLTLDKVADLQARFNAINTYTSLFYTDAEKLGYFTKQVTSQFTALNQALPQSRDAFRALVDGVDTTTTSGMSLFNSLIDLAPTMDAYYKALQQQEEATKNVVEAMANLDINKFKTLVDYTRAQRYIENGNSTQGIPGFASGGLHAGGLRIVGENGPELEATGPARIVSNNELMSRLRNPDANNQALIAEIGRLRQENQAAQVAIAQATQKMAKILDKFDNQGIALSETNNSGTRIILDTRVVV